MREDKNWHDAKSAWRELFQISLSGVLAGPCVRAAYLKKMLSVEDLAVKDLVFEGISSMLQVHHFSATYTPSFGGRSRGFGWSPVSEQDVYNWYENSLDLIWIAFSSGGENKKRACEVVRSEFSALWSKPLLRHKLAELISSMGNDGKWSGAWATVGLTLQAHFDSLSEEERLELRELRNIVSPRSLTENILVYVLSHGGGFLNAQEINDDDDFSAISDYEAVSNTVVQLGIDCSHEITALKEVLPYLQSEKGGRQFEFGFGIASGCSSAVDIWDLLQNFYSTATQGDFGNFDILRGYIEGLRRKGVTEHGLILDTLLENEIFFEIYPAIHGAARDGEGAKRLHRSLDIGCAPADAFKNLLPHDGNTLLQAEEYSRLISRVADLKDGGLASIALTAQALARIKDTDEEFSIAYVNLIRKIFHAFDFSASGDMAGVFFTKIVEIAVQGYEWQEDVEVFMKKFANAFFSHEKYTHNLEGVARLIFSRYPVQSLDSFLLKDEKSAASIYRPRYQFHRKNAIEMANFDSIISWVTINAQERAHLVAAEIEVFTSENGKLQWSALVDKILEFTKDKTQLLEVLSWRMSPKMYIGSVSQTLAPMLDFAYRLSLSSTPDMAIWAQAIVRGLEERIRTSSTETVFVERDFESGVR